MSHELFDFRGIISFQAFFSKKISTFKNFHVSIIIYAIVQEFSMSNYFSTCFCYFNCGFFSCQ